MRSFLLLAGGLLLAAASIFAAPVGSLEPRSPPHTTQHSAADPAHAHAVAHTHNGAHTMAAAHAHNDALTMASMRINLQQQTNSALASVVNKGAKNVADAAKGQ